MGLFSFYDGSSFELFFDFPSYFPFSCYLSGQYGSGEHDYFVFVYGYIDDDEPDDGDCFRDSDVYKRQDVAYVDRVAGDLSKHFGDVVGRKLPKADLPVLLECLSLDSGIPLGENAVQVLFIYDEESKKMDAFQPSDLEKELNNVAFKSQLGEFALYSFEPSDMASREELFLESLRVVVDAKAVSYTHLSRANRDYIN